MKIKERIILMNILPSEGSFEDLLVIEDVRKKVNLSQEELEKMEIKTQENRGITWNQEKDKGKKINFSEIEKNLISKILKKLSDEKKLTIDMMDLYKQFN